MTPELWAEALRVLRRLRDAIGHEMQCASLAALCTCGEAEVLAEARQEATRFLNSVRTLG